jgi:hypothetical protein
MHMIREDKEKDWIELNRIQDRFVQFKDKDTMHNIPKSKFDYMGSENDEASCSTEFSDFEIHDMY